MKRPDTRPDLYRALIADGWDFRPLQGGGGVFGRLVGVQFVGIQSIAVRMTSRLSCTLSVDRIEVATFRPAAPDGVIAAAAIAQRQELGA